MGAYRSACTVRTALPAPQDPRCGHRKPVRAACPLLPRASARGLVHPGSLAARSGLRVRGTQAASDEGLSRSAGLEAEETNTEFSAPPRAPRP